MAQWINRDKRPFIFPRQYWRIIKREFLWSETGAGYVDKLGRRRAFVVI